jgi:hypothetical protein
MTNIQPHIREIAWIDTRAPVEGQIVLVRVQDTRGFYILPFPVEFRDDDWWNARTGEELDCFIAGWTPWDDLAEDAP